jgi:hypothetical protein
MVAEREEVESNERSKVERARGSYGQVIAVRKKADICGKGGCGSEGRKIRGGWW